MRNQRGGASIEMVLLTPVLISVLLLVVVGGRLVSARNDVAYAAKVSARSASIERSTAKSEASAREAAAAALASQHITCSRLDVTIDTSELRPGGQTTANLVCDVDLSSASLLGLPLTKTVKASFTEPVDTYIGSGS